MGFGWIALPSPSAAADRSGMRSTIYNGDAFAVGVALPGKCQSLVRLFRAVYIVLLSRQEYSTRS